VKKYIKISLNLLQFYKIDKKLDKIEAEWDIEDNLSREVRLDILDMQVTDLLLQTEKKYRKLQTEEINFSLDVSRAVNT
jgi:hypothetical protein